MDLFKESQRELDERNVQLEVTSQNLVSTQAALTVTRQDLTTTTRQKKEGEFLIDEHVKVEQVMMQEAEQVQRIS